MMTLKLQKHRTGKRKYFYSVIIISTKSKPLSGKFVEKIGYYHPNPDQWNHKNIFIDMNRLSFWISRGVKINKMLYILIKPLVWIL